MFEGLKPQKLSQIQKSELKDLQKIKVDYISRPKSVFDPNPTQQIAHYGPKKSRTTQKLSQIQKSELKESQKMKVV